MTNEAPKKNTRQRVLEEIEAITDEEIRVRGRRLSAAEIAEALGVSVSTARKHAMALAEAGKIRATRSRRYDSQARYTNYGVEGASCMRRVIQFDPARGAAEGGIFGSY